MVVVGRTSAGPATGRDVALDLLDLMRGRELEEIGADHRIQRAATLVRERLVAVDDGAVGRQRETISLCISRISSAVRAEVPMAPNPLLPASAASPSAGTWPATAGCRSRPAAMRTRSPGGASADRTKPGVGRFGLPAFKPCCEHGTRQQCFCGRAHQLGPSLPSAEARAPLAASTTTTPPGPQHKAAAGTPIASRVTPIMPAVRSRSLEPLHLRP